MPNYMIAPYLFQVNVRQQGKTKAQPIENIDGRGLTLAQATENVLASMLARREPYRHLSDKDKVFALDDVQAATPNAYLLHVEPGWRGLQSDLRDADGTSLFQRRTHNSEHVKLRHLIYFVPNSYSAIVFAERYGKMGAITFLRQSLISTLREKLPSLTFHIDPLTTLTGIESSKVKGMNFIAPRRRDSSGNLLDWGPRMEIRFSWRDRGIKSVLTDAGEIDRQAVFGVLRAEAQGFGLGNPVDLSDWDALLEVKTRSGAARTFSITRSAGPGLVYPISSPDSTDSVTGDSYPSDDQYIATCQTILTDLEGQFDISNQTKLPSRGRFQVWNGGSVTPWEVTCYDDPEPRRNS